MQYLSLDEQGLTQIRAAKLAELEREHARLALDLVLAETAGIDSAKVAEAQRHLEILELQHATLRSWLAPAPEPEAVPDEGD